MKFAVFGVIASVDIRLLPGAWVVELLTLGPGPQKDQISTASILVNGSYRVNFSVIFLSYLVKVNILCSDVRRPISSEGMRMLLSQTDHHLD